jgi:hypothetical protein
MLIEGIYVLDQVSEGEPHLILLSIVKPGTSLPMKIDNQIED